MAPHPTKATDTLALDAPNDLVGVMRLQGTRFLFSPSTDCRKKRGIGIGIYTLDPPVREQDSQGGVPSLSPHSRIGVIS